MTSIDVVAPPRAVLAWSRAMIDAPLKAAFAALPDETREVVEYHRSDFSTAALALLAADAVGDAIPAIRVATAVELAHQHEQLHADLMTRALSRGHQPSAWVEFGDDRAVSAADALISLAFAQLTRPEVMILNAALLSVVDGYVQEAEMDERDDVDIAEYLGVAAAKHSALTACACELGALAAGAVRSQAVHLREFGDDVGLARKHVDDVLAIWGGAPVSGRPLYDDLAHRRRTLPVVAAINAGTDVYATDAEPRELALRVERAGGRKWCEQQAELLLARALNHLRQAGPRARAAEDLSGLAREITTARFAPARTPAPAVPSQSTAASREDRTPS
ncbi:geranylgeranyl diphosphate synthase type I [Lentzea atacamensis]|uniref:Geranylgeranyl diphosphate synthase type I n=1 Tax=Lentzea atacamensis TaxID=531938 RepID=A0A316ICC1_9PSEU|nr:polyprenyl synthetase family protein [Lentzea atacamensis]PWK87972.1 geranylgeranyl diphosphate synthase type I [Lentzea atacamensis]